MPRGLIISVFFSTLKIPVLLFLSLVSPYVVPHQYNILTANSKSVIASPLRMLHSPVALALHSLTASALHSPAPPVLHSPVAPALHSPTPLVLHSPVPPALHSLTAPVLHSPVPPALHSPTAPALHSPTPPALHCPTPPALRCTYVSVLSSGVCI